MMRSAIVALSLVAFPTLAQACSVCFGDPNSPASKGVTAAVLFMVALVGCVLGSVFVTLLIWHRRSRQIKSG